MGWVYAGLIQVLPTSLKVSLSALRYQPIRSLFNQKVAQYELLKSRSIKLELVYVCKDWSRKKLFHHAVVIILIGLSDIFGITIYCIQKIQIDFENLNWIFLDYQMFVIKS